MKSYHDIASDGGSNVLEQVTVQQKRLQERLADIRDVIAVASGKGGVGKSTLTACLAAALSQAGLASGVLDTDLNGPSIAHMMGVQEHIPHAHNGAMSPAFSYGRVPVMSMDLLLPAGSSTPVLWQAPTQRGAYAWRALAEMNAIKELLADTHWGALDVLLVDLAPGADRLQNLADLLPDLSGALVITTPTAVAQTVVGRSITMASDVANVPVVGLVENMSGITCSRCGHKEPLFVGAPRAQDLAQKHGIPFLGSVPFDARLAHSLDQGRPFLEAYPTTPTGKAIFSIADALRIWLEL